MALIPVREIFWRRNSPYGGYVANDVVSIYWDNVALAIVVHKNGTVITSGNSIPFHFQSAGNSASYYKTETGGNQLEIDLVVCNGTTRVQFPRTISYFPYVVQKNLSGNPSCSVTPSVCDLTINSLPIVVNETSQGAIDGEITVTGSTSNGTIEYKLNSDFVFGEGDSSGVFTDLASGVYTIYARDSANCSDTISVTVSYDVPYNTRYILEYEDRVGDSTKIEIQERDYLGSSEEIKGGGTPILIRQRGEGQQDKFVPILGCEIDITLISEIKYQFQTLFTSDPNKYRVIYSKDFGSGFTTLSIGKLLPNQYREVYTDPPYAVNFLSTDGLAALKDIPFTDSTGSNLFGSYKSIQIIAYCLKATGLLLNIRCGINLYADEMDETDSDDPLDQAYVDVDSYYTDETISYLDVLVRILEPYGAQLTQWGGYWNIVRVEEKTDEYDFREFDPSGEYVSNGSIDPIIVSQDKTTEGVIWVEAPEFEMNPAYGKINLTYNLGLKPNLIRNGDFKLRDIFNFFVNRFVAIVDFRGFQIIPNGDDGVGGRYQVVDENKIYAGNNPGTILPDKNNIALILAGGKGNAYIQSQPTNIKLGFNDSLVFTIKCGVPTFEYQSYPYVKIRCIISYGSYYLTGSGRWSTTASEIVFFSTSFGNYTEFSVTSIGYPTGADAGLDLVIRVYSAYVFDYDTDSVANQRAIVTGGTLVNAGSFVPGTRYQIRTVGSTDFTQIGAASNTVGLEFISTGSGSGTGTALDSPLGIGYRTQRIDNAAYTLYYYELENNTSAESVPDIVRPNDYNASTNPVQWILKTVRGSSYAAPKTFAIDKIEVKYLSDGYAPPSKFEASISGESNNPNILTKEVRHGSLVEIVQNTTRTQPVISLLPFFWQDTTEQDYIETVIQNNEKTYSGYFRDSSGVGFENWHRSYISESLKLHEIQLKSLAAQYNSTWKRMRGALTGAEYVSPLNSIREERDDDTIYYPISLEIDDKNRVFSGEFVELSRVVTTDDDDEVSGVGFSNGFSIGFNS